MFSENLVNKFEEMKKEVSKELENEMDDLAKIKGDSLRSFVLFSFEILFPSACYRFLIYSDMMKKYYSIIINVSILQSTICNIILC